MVFDWARYGCALCMCVPWAGIAMFINPSARAVGGRTRLRKYRTRDRRERSEDARAAAAAVAVAG